jgi:hypothetical protein
VYHYKFKSTYNTQMSVQHLKTVVVFSPSKHHHKQHVEQHVPLGGSNFNKVEFFHALRSLRKDASKSSIVISTFKQSGNWPLDSALVLSKIPTLDRRAPPPASAASATTPKTPITAVEIVEYTRKHLQGIDPYTGEVGLLAHCVTKLAKNVAAVGAAHEAQVADMNKVTAATNYRKKQQVQDKRVVQSGGTVSAEDVRLRVAKRSAKDKTLVLCTSQCVN